VFDRRSGREHTRSASSRDHKGAAHTFPIFPHLSDRNHRRTFGTVPARESATVGAILPVLPICCV
jgi:hypothetical protein